MSRLVLFGLIFFALNSFAASSNAYVSISDDGAPFEVRFLAKRTQMANALFYPSQIRCELIKNESYAPGTFLGQQGPLIYRSAELVIWFSDDSLGLRLLAKSNSFTVASRDGEVDRISESSLEIAERLCNRNLDAAEDKGLLVSIQTKLTSSSIGHLISTEDNSFVNRQKVVNSLVSIRADGTYRSLIVRPNIGSPMYSHYICVTETVVDNEVVNKTQESLGVRPLHRRPQPSECE